MTCSVYPYSGLEGQNFSIHVLHEKVQGFLLENKIQTFYQQELETVDCLVSLMGVHLPSPSSEEVSECTCSKLLVGGDNTMYFFKA